MYKSCIKCLANVGIIFLILLQVKNKFQSFYHWSKLWGFFPLGDQLLPGMGSFLSLSQKPSAQPSSPITIQGGFTVSHLAIQHIHQIWLKMTQGYSQISVEKAKDLPSLRTHAVSLTN